MSSFRTSNQICTATAISWFAQCHISFRLLRSSVGTFVLIEIYWGNHMSVADWVNRYGIHHWSIFWGSYRKLAWVGFEPTTTEFRSDGLTNRAIRTWVELGFRANFVQLLIFHRLFSVTFHLGYCLGQWPYLFQSKFCWGNHMNVAEWVDTYGIYHRMNFWSSYRKLAWVGFEPMTTEFRSDVLTDWSISPRVQLGLRANL